MALSSKDYKQYHLTILDRDKKRLDSLVLLLNLLAKGKVETLPSSIVQEVATILFYNVEKSREEYLSKASDEVMKLISRLKLNLEVTIKRNWDKKQIVISYKNFVSDYFTSLHNLTPDTFVKTISNNREFINFSYKLLFNYLRLLPIKLYKEISINQKAILIGALGVPFGLFRDEETYQAGKYANKHYSEYLVTSTIHFCKKKHKELSQKKS